MAMVVEEGAGPNLLGRSRLRDLNLLPQLVNKVKAMPALKLEDVLERNAEVFKEEPGQFRGNTGKIHVNPKANP